MQDACSVETNKQGPALRTLFHSNQPATSLQPTNMMAQPRPILSRTFEHLNVHTFLAARSDLHVFGCCTAHLSAATRYCRTGHTLYSFRFNMDLTDEKSTAPDPIGSKTIAPHAAVFPSYCALEDPSQSKATQATQTITVHR